MADPSGLSIPLSISSGPAISGGNPTAGPSATGAFNVYTGGRNSAGQMLAPWLPLVAIGVIWWAMRRK